MIKINKGLDLPIPGKPIPVISDKPNITSVALLANDFVGMKPTMLVKSGDVVKAGSKLFEDKKNQGVFFTSPAGGTVSSINRGDKRKFLSIEIDISGDEQFEDFSHEISTKDIKSLLINSGLWNAFRTRPFNRTPSVDASPNALFINACDTNPLSSDPFHIIKKDKDLFDKGLDLVKSYFNCPIHLSYQNNDFDTTIEGIHYHQFVGPHPAGLSSTHINKIFPVSLNRSSLDN